MLPRLISVKPGKNYQLLLKYDNGEKRIFNVKPFISQPEFQKLNSKTFFHSVKVQDGVVSWAGNIKFTAETLYYRSTEYTNRFISSGLLLAL